MDQKVDFKEINFDFFKRIVFKYTPEYILGSLSILAISLLQIQIPGVTGKIIDEIKTSNFKIQNIIKMLLLIVIYGLGMFLFRFLWRHFISNSGRKIQRDFRKELYFHVLNMDDHFFKKSKIGDLMAIFTNDLGAVREAMVGGFVSLIDAVIILILVSYKLIRIDFKMAVLLLSPYLLIAAVYYIALKVSDKLVVKEKYLFGELSQKVQESFSGIRIIKTFARENLFKNKFEENHNEYRKVSFKISFLWSVIFSALTIFVSLISLTLLFFGGTMILEDKITIGTYMEISAYLNMILWPMLAIGSVVNSFQNGVSGFYRMSKIINKQSSIIENKDALDENPSGKIEVKNLNFTYSDGKEDILKNVSFVIEKGQFLGILGGVGSGKSTLIKLLTRMIDFEEGEILYDGIDIKKYKINNIRKSIGVVLQNNFLFSDTIKNNIKFAVPEATEEEIKRVCDISTISRDILLFESGFETEVGEKGVSLSGGQKQRISLARALLLNPNILILDDAMSAVDTETEEKILKDVLEYRNNKTTIMISNRISTLSKAEKILVLKDGRVVQEGSHMSLINEKKGFYREIYELQKLSD